jgi:CubicO group peptidase (beta-lactamase class C family)
MLFRLALLAALASSCLAQDAARMDQIVQSYVTSEHFTGTVLVARGAQVVFSKGYGSANLEWNIPNSPNTKFRLGSVTKQFTAASILLLEERGKLSVSDPVKKYLPDAPAAWDEITIFNLLTHTSGIPNFTGFPDYAKLEPLATTSEAVVARFRDKPLDFQPGEKYSYSNSGYALLSYLIERITGGAYEKFLQENIFTPLGMKDSGYDSNSAVIPRRASGYVFGRNGFENASYVHMTVPQGAGAIYSTAEDLLKWEQGLFGGKVVSAASLQKMTTPFKSNYAFGLQVDNAGGHKVVEHGGAISGFLTELAYYPDDKLTVVVLENATGAAQPGAIATKLAELGRGENVKLPSERKEITLDSKTLSRYVGAYQMVSGANMVIALDGSQLSSKLGPQRPIPIFPESQTMFFPKAVDAELEFAKNDDQGRPTELILHQNGRDMAGKRLDDVESKRIMDAAVAESKRMADAAALAAIRFKEQKPMAGSEAALRRDIDELRAGEPKYELMSPGLADVTRQQLPQLKATITELGAVQSVTFKGVGPGGADIYEVKFEHGSTEWRISMDPDGKVGGVGFRNQ